MVLLYNIKSNMRHYIQYHNPQRYGPPEQHLPGNPFWIATRKNPYRLPGNTIWVVLGEGTPRTYSLYQVFIAGWVESSQDPDFLYNIGGYQGVRFEPLIELNPIPWFQAMKRSLGNFSLGLTEVTHSYAAYLISLAQANSSQYRQVEENGWFKTHAPRARNHLCF
jgi:hypothetical protein